MRWGGWLECWKKTPNGVGWVPVALAANLPRFVADTRPQPDNLPFTQWPRGLLRDR